jgi:hypothetical protein
VRLRTAVSLPVLIALAAIAGCGAEEPTARPTTFLSQSMAPDPGSDPMSTSTATISGNGVAELDPSEIVERARRATLSAPSVRLRGREGNGDEVTSDIRFEGRRAAGQLTPAGGPRFDLILDGEAFYLKAARSYWVSVGGERAGNLLAGKYLRTTVDDPDYAPFALSCSLRTTLARELGGTDFSSPALRKPTTLHGVPAVPVESMGTIVYVAAKGQPYLQKIELVLSSVEFLDYGRRFDIRPPAQAVDVSELRAIQDGASR